MTHQPGPTPAERARTAAAQAGAGTLSVRGCRTGRTLTLVTVTTGDDGFPLVGLERSSPTAALLRSCPVVTLTLPGPDDEGALQLVGPLRPLPEPPGAVDEWPQFRLSPLSVRLVRGATRQPVPVEEFLRARPDPLRDLAPSALRHLEEAHAEDLLACVRAQGYDVAAVVPRRLDRYGLELAGLAADGVHRLRLHFPDGGVQRLEELAAGMRLPLTCRCHEPRERS